MYTVYLFTQGRGEGGGELNQREGYMGPTVQKVRPKIPT